jgi:hypothetical protein
MEIWRNLFGTTCQRKRFDKMLIANKKTLQFYIDYLLPELIQSEVYFLSLSARNKYLTEEERKYYGLGRTEMFSRVIVRSKQDFDKAIRQLEANHSARLTKTEQIIPEKCLVVYINVNPVSTVKAAGNFVQEFLQVQNELTISLQNQKQSNFDWFRYADRKYMNCLQQATSRKIWIDFDIDSHDYSIVRELIDSIDDVVHLSIETKSGYHLLVNQNDLNNKNAGKYLFNMYNDLRKLHVDIEIMQNKNAMIPLPGSFHGEKEVKIVSYLLD